jgi:hypothetical protein
MATPPPLPLTRRQSSSDAFITRHSRPATIEEGAFVPLDDLLRETFLSVRRRARSRDAPARNDHLVRTPARSWPSGVTPQACES